MLGSLVKNRLLYGTGYYSIIGDVTVGTVIISIIINPTYLAWLKD